MTEKDHGRVSLIRAEDANPCRRCPHGQLQHEGGAGTCTATVTLPGLAPEGCGCDGYARKVVF